MLLILIPIFLFILIFTLINMYKEDKEMLKTINDAHDETINATLLRVDDIPDDMEQANLAVQFSEWPCFDVYKCSN